MKKILSFLSVLLMLILCTCSKDNLEKGFTPDLAGDESVKAACGMVINVSPVEGEDTPNLIAAFEDAKSAGPGTTVKLAAGEYQIGFVFVKEFFGSFTGAGMGKTIIEPLLNLPASDDYAQGLGTDLLKFLRGNVKVSNMSFRNLEGDPVPYDVLWQFIGFHDWAYNELPNLPVDHKITAVVDHVEFVSHLSETSPWSPYTVSAGIGCGPDFYWGTDLPYCTIDVTVTNCTFNDMNSAMTCGMNDNKNGRTVFSNNGPVKTNISLWIINNIGGRTLISGNEFYQSAGSGYSILINPGLWWGVNDRSKMSVGAFYEIFGNTFHTTDSWGSIGIANDRPVTDNKNPLLAVIMNNLFDLKGSTWAGIWNWITDNAIVSNNRFVGEAKTGIYVDPRTEHSLMMGNNFTKLTCTGLPEIPGYLTIPVAGDYDILLLGNYNTVFGGFKNGTSVLNLGEHNIITGAKVHNESKIALKQPNLKNYMNLKENLINMRRH